MWKSLTLFPSLLSVECETSFIIQELCQSRQLLKTCQLFGKCIHNVIFLCFFSFFIHTPGYLLNALRQRERENTLMGKRNTQVVSCTGPGQGLYTSRSGIRDWTCNSVMCPDQELKWHPFCYRTTFQQTEPDWTEPHCHFIPLSWQSHFIALKSGTIHILIQLTGVHGIWFLTDSILYWGKPLLR